MWFRRRVGDVKAERALCKQLQMQYVRLESSTASTTQKQTETVAENHTRVNNTGGRRKPKPFSILLLPPCGEEEEGEE